jgi:hypothetical protein
LQNPPARIPGGGFGAVPRRARIEQIERRLLFQPGAEDPAMAVVKMVCWQDGGWWLGYLLDYPDQWTQGITKDDLKEHLRDLYRDLGGEHPPAPRFIEDLIVE